MNKIYVARRRRNAIMMSLSFGATLVGLGWLVLILGVLLWEGFSGLSVAVFTEMTPPPGADGGLLNPIVGSLILTVLAVLIGTPGDDPFILGGPGDDRIEGRGGDDILRGEEGRDVYLGGRGTDTLQAKDRRRDRRLDCGPGSDFVKRDRIDPKPVHCAPPKPEPVDNRKK